jgi:hypothetical protein
MKGLRRIGFAIRDYIDFRHPLNSERSRPDLPDLAEVRFAPSFDRRVSGDKNLAGSSYHGDCRGDSGRAEQNKSAEPTCSHGGNIKNPSRRERGSMGHTFIVIPAWD